MSRLRLILAAALLFTVRDASAHGTSKSYADWTIEGSRAELRVNFAPHDFALAIPSIDADNDQRVTEAELQPMKEEVLKRVIEATRLSSAREKGQPLVACTPEKPRLTTVGEPLEELQITATYSCTDVIGVIELKSRYLPELEPPHVSVATFTAGAINAQHIYTSADDLPFMLELEPPTVRAVLVDHLKRGASATACAALVLCLGVLCFLAGLRGAPILFGAFAGALAIAIFVPVASIPALVALAVALAGIESLLPKASVPRRALIAGVLGVALGLGAPAAAVPMRIAYLFGALAPVVVVALGAALLSTYKTRVIERAAGVASLAGSVALLVLSLR